MDDIVLAEVFRFPSAVRHDPAIDAWFDARRPDLGPLGRAPFDAMRQCGPDVRELMHDGRPTACVEDAAFGPVDRIGQLTMRNLDIADSRAKLELYAAQGLLGSRAAELVGELAPGGATAIAANPAAADVDSTDDALDRAAMEFGTD